MKISMIRLSLCSGILFLTLAAFLAFSSVAPARAAESEARQRLEATINAVLAELKKPAFKNQETQPQVLASVEKIIVTLFDFGELSMRTVGPAWRTFTEDQKKRFQDAFTNLLRESYLEKLNGYDGETISYLGEDMSSDGNRAEIRTAVDIMGKPVPVSYRMTRKANWMVYDVIIEGVSMVQNYRTQFQELLSRNDPEQLIRIVNDRTMEMRKHNQQQQTAQ